MWIEEEDGAPSRRFRRIKVTDDTLVDNGDGSATLDTFWDTILDADQAMEWHASRGAAACPRSVSFSNFCEVPRD